MPWSERQHKLFEAASHDDEVAQERGLTKEEAQKLADEGVKKSTGFIDLAPVFGNKDA